MVDCLIIGGGAAGCYAAITAAQRGLNVLICEHNPRGELGKKLKITGKGRCNVTNDCDLDALLANIPRNGRFLYSAFSNCMPQDVMAFFEDLGVELKVERGNRVFPVSDSAGEIVNALIAKCRSLGVKTEHCHVTALRIDETGACVGVNTDSGEIMAKTVILAAGGMSYPATGSDGSGFVIAEQAGHQVVAPMPSLVPLVCTEADCADMMGLSLKNVTLSLFDTQKKNRCCYSELGEMLFTHFGVSGPLVLSASAHIERPDAGRYTLAIDLKPGLTPEQLDARIQRDFAGAQNRVLGNALGKLLPRAIILPTITRAGLDPELRVNSVTREQRHALGETIKRFELHVKGFRPVSEAIVTRGGVDVREVQPKTMESKLIPNLYFAGEVLDVDAYTGGFNLQIAFATAFAAGNAAADSISWEDA
ncbi:MAG: NAD(P)/FAD-dependent oxidoreductase [Ruminococcus sp.]|nr:NAD(P)/FAD-dependent oxidoreductase [Ruminococcus sp.]